MSPSHSYFMWLAASQTYPLLSLPLSYIFGGSGAELVVLEQVEKKNISTFISRRRSAIFVKILF